MDSLEQKRVELRAKNRDAQRKWRAANPEKQREYQRNWYAANPDKRRTYAKKHNRTYDSIYGRMFHLKRAYGLTTEQWNCIFEDQGRCCAICKCEHAKWHTDHCHSTGKVRGILCRSCNFTLGHARDKVSVLLSAIKYLRRNQS